MTENCYKPCPACKSRMRIMKNPRNDCVVKEVNLECANCDFKVQIDFMDIWNESVDKYNKKENLK